MASRDSKRSLDSLPPVTIDSATAESPGPDRKKVSAQPRGRADKAIRQNAIDLPAKLGHLSKAEIRHALRELQERQVELQLQNENLRGIQVELEAARAHYFDLYDLAPVGYCTLSRSGQILEANLTAARLFKLDRSLLTRQLLSRFVHPEDQATFYLHLAGLFDSGEPQSGELRMLKKDETVFWLHLDATIAHDPDGTPVGRIVLTDISQRKQAEKALLKSSEERFRQLLQDVQSVAVRGYGPDCITHYWNHASELLYGYSAREAIGRNTLDLVIPPEIREEVRQTICQTIEAGRPLPPGELSLMRKDGSRITVFSNHVLIRLPGRPLEIYCIDIDVSDRKQMEASLHESEERFRQLFESTSDALLLLAPDTCQIITANKKVSELYGYNQEEILTRNCMDLSAEPEGTFDHSPNVQPSAGLMFQAPQCLHRKKDGSVFPVEIASRNFLFKGKSLLLVAIRDVSERIQAEKEKSRLEAFNWQLQKRESLKRMAGAIAHHFNNRLAAVIGNIELAIDDLPRDSRPSHVLNNALQAAQKAAEVSGLLLTYLGQASGSFAPLDLSETCRNNLSLLQAASPKAVTLSFDLPAQGPIVNGNAHQLQQVINNLITNACEASIDNKGTVNLSIRTITQNIPPAEHRYPIGWQPAITPYACIEVKDSGCGIDRQDMDKLFDPFFSNKFTGRGLGLPVVLGIVKAHGGAVSVVSESGKGSIFSVLLPLFDEATMHGQQAAVTIVPEEYGGAVLLVEDEDSIREMTEAMLTRLGFSVLSAKNGVEAVDIFLQHKEAIRCVFCDLTMPQMDGYETFNALKEISPQLKIIILSGYNKEQVFDRFAGRDLAGFLHKPYSQTELAAMVRLTLEQ